MKEYKPTYIDPTITPIEPILWVNKELIEKGIYARYSIKTQSVTGTGNYRIITGFPPKLLQVQVQDTDQMSDWKTDFTSTFSIRAYNNTWLDSTIGTSSSSNLISLSTLVWNATTRHEDGVTINISSYAWSAKTLYITSYS